MEEMNELQGWCSQCKATTRLALAELDQLIGSDGEIDFRHYIGTTICMVCGCDQCEATKPLPNPNAS